MPSFPRPIARIAQWRGWLPLAIPLAMFAALLALGGDRGYFYRYGSYNAEASHKTLTVAENLSPRHNFLMAISVWQRADGGFEYRPYNRFPIGGFILVKMVISPFGDDLAAKLVAARVLAMLMFCAAALFAYLALARIAGSRWIALAATLFAFSGLYALFHADEVHNESAMDLFGVTLTFHGMVVFVQEGRFRQLLVKTCAALIVGWHVNALVLPFAAAGFGGEAAALVRSAIASGGGIRAAVSMMPALVRSRYAILAAVSVLITFGTLTFNFANEYMSYDGNRALSELPAFRALARRLGPPVSRESDIEAAERAGFFGRRLIRLDAAWWGDFSMRQFYRAGVSSAPYAAARLTGYDFFMEPTEPPFGWSAWGIAATCAALAALALFPRRFRVPIAALALMGLFWALLLRHSALVFYHHLEGLFHVGLPLTLFCAALIGARRLLGARLGGMVAIAAAALAAPVFALSVAYAAQVNRDARIDEFHKTLLAEFSEIVEMTRGKRVLVASPPEEWDTNSFSLLKDSLGHFLAGSYVKGSYNCESRPAGYADFTLSSHRDDSLNLLTPENRFAFLYGNTDPLDLCRSERRLFESSEPSARSTFDVYLKTDFPPALYYYKSDCSPQDYDAPFFVHFYLNDPLDRDQFARIEFKGVSPVARFKRRAAFDDACLMTPYLAEDGYYRAALIRTGQYISGGERLWEVSITPPVSEERIARYEETYRATASGEPAARSVFDLYLDGGALIYLKQPCSEADARGRFFLSVHPVDILDLPEERRALGHDSLNFDFSVPPPPRKARCSTASAWQSCVCLITKSPKSRPGSGYPAANACGTRR